MRAPLSLALSLLLLSPLVGCSDDDAAADDTGGRRTGPPDAEVIPRTSLVQHNLWRPVSAENDPFDDRPAEVTCELTGYGSEALAGEDAFHVNMRGCDYMTATQVSLTDIVAGDEIKVRFWHFDLQSEDPDAEAHAALLFDGDQVWEAVVPIPQDGGALISETVTVDTDYPTGTTIHYHVHNHGLNEYFLIELSRTDR